MFWNTTTNSFQSPGAISIKFGPDANVPTRFGTSAIGLSLQPQYNNNVTGNDIAVVTLRTPVAITPVVVVGLATIRCQHRAPC